MQNFSYLRHREGNQLSWVKIGMYSLFGLLSGSFYGWTKWEKQRHFSSTDHLTEYENQDQINCLIESKRLPAVIYYYSSGQRSHIMNRSNMIKFSNLHSTKAIWVMVNMPKHLEHAREALREIRYTHSMHRIEVRFPKSDLAIFEKTADDITLVAEKRAHRREVYSFLENQKDFQAFLEDNGVIPGKDPIQPLITITHNALFQTIPQAK